MHGRVGYACVTEPEQRSALNRCTCQKLASRVGTGPVARRCTGPAVLSVRSAFNVRELADAKYARRKRPVLEDAPPPIAAWQLLPRRGLLGDQVRVARERRYARLRPAAASSATTARDAAATAGLTVFTSSCSVADAAAVPSFGSGRRREAADRAQTATTALLDLRSVSQWVRRVYQPQLRRETDGRHLLLLSASRTCADRVLMLRAARGRCTG